MNEILNEGVYRQNRLRAQSVTHTPTKNISTSSLNRNHSENDLSKIDRSKTFEEANMLAQPAELISKIVTALGNIQPTSENNLGVLELAMENRFLKNKESFNSVDSHILNSERRSSNWSISPSVKSTLTPTYDIKNPETLDSPKFSKKSKIPGITKISNQDHENNLYRAAFQNQMLKKHMETSTCIDIPDDRIVPKNPKIRSVSECEPIGDNKTRRQSGTGSLQHYKNRTHHGRGSICSLTVQANETDQTILENTSIADLIRAIELVHTRIHSTNLATQTFISHVRRINKKLG